HGAHVAGPEIEASVDDDERDAPEENQGHQRRLPDDPSHQQALQRPADQEEQRHRNRQSDQRVDAAQRVEPERAVGAKHHEVAVGEVDDAQDAENEVEPGGGERVHRAEQQDVDDQLEDG